MAGKGSSDLLLASDQNGHNVVKFSPRLTKATGLWLRSNATIQEERKYLGTPFTEASVQCLAEQETSWSGQSLISGHSELLSILRSVWSSRPPQAHATSCLQNVPFYSWAVSKRGSCPNREKFRTGSDEASSFQKASLVRLWLFWVLYLILSHECKYVPTHSAHTYTTFHVFDAVPSRSCNKDISERRTRKSSHLGTCQIFITQSRPNTRRVYVPQRSSDTLVLSDLFNFRTY